MISATLFHCLHNKKTNILNTSWAGYFDFLFWATRFRLVTYLFVKASRPRDIKVIFKSSWHLLLLV